MPQIFYTRCKQDWLQSFNTGGHLSLVTNKYVLFQCENGYDLGVNWPWYKSTEIFAKVFHLKHWHTQFWKDLSKTSLAKFEAVERVSNTHYTVCIFSLHKLFKGPINRPTLVIYIIYIKCILTFLTHCHILMSCTAPKTSSTNCISYCIYQHYWW